MSCTKCIRASDMPLPSQNHAFTTARRIIDDSMSPKIETKRLALALKKDFEYGRSSLALHSEETSFGSYVMHSIGRVLGPIDMKH